MGDGRMIGFVIWLLIGSFFIGNGFACFKAKKATGFWANARTAPIEDVKSYNRAMGKLWCGYGVGFMILGIPMVMKSGVWIMASVVGIMIESIALMIVYTIIIEPKYRKK